MFRIGDFSRLARVTIRTLHHYDEAGLLQPAHVDPQTGYRYYSAAQLRTMQRILLLKDLGFALEEIRQLTEASVSADEFARVLDARREHIIASIAENESRLRRLDALHATVTSTLPVEVSAVVLRDTPAFEVYALRERVAHLSRVQSMFERAEAEVGRKKLRAHASPLLIFHDNDYREIDVDVEVCIPLHAADNALPSRTLGAASMACVTYQGAYDQTAPLYEAMLSWLERTGLAINGPLREVYHRFGADQVGYRLPAQMLAKSSADYVTELQVPVVSSHGVCPSP